MGGVRGTRQLIAATAVAFALGIGLGACGDSDPGTTTAASETDDTGAADVEKIDLRKAGATDVSLDGDWLVGTDDAVWLSAGPEFLRLDPKTGKQTDSVRVPGGLCLDPVYAFGAIYSATCYAEKGLVRIDPGQLEVTKTVDLPTSDLYNGEASIAAGEGAIWLVVDGDGCEACVLVGLDPKTLSRKHEVDLDPGAESVAVGGGYVWVSDSEKNRVLRIDPDSGKIVGETKVGGLPRYLAVDSNGVWVLNAIEGTVMQLDLKTGEVLKTIEADMGGAGGVINVADGSVWDRATATLLKQIDSKTGEIVAQYGPDTGGGDVLVRDGVLWVSAVKAAGHLNGPGAGVVYRLPLDQPAG